MRVKLKGHANLALCDSNEKEKAKIRLALFVQPPKLV